VKSSVAADAAKRVSARELLRLNVISGRADADISQEELAKRSDVSRAWISRIESGSADPGLDVIDRIAAALGKSVAELFVEYEIDVREPDDDELIRRAAAPDDEFVDAQARLDAIDEAAGRPSKRYSRRGRPPLARRTFVPTEELKEAFAHLAPIDYKQFRADIDAHIDQSVLPGDDR